MFYKAFSFPSATSNTQSSSMHYTRSTLNLNPESSFCQSSVVRVENENQQTRRLRHISRIGKYMFIVYHFA